MLVILAVILLIYKINSGIFLLQLPYYLICTLVFLYSFTLLSSTISTIVRDYQLILQSIIRMMLYLLPILWDMSNLPNIIVTILKLNPIFYLIEGFRNTFLGLEWFYDDILYTLYFWLVTFIILMFGSILHLKFRSRFVDYL